MKARTQKVRIPEGGAIRDEEGMSAERYAEIMKKRLWKEYRRFAALSLELGRTARDGRALEIGSGPGWISILLAGERPDLKIDMVDASADMVRASRANVVEAGLASHVSVGQGTAERIDEAVSGPYDLVYSHDSLHHWSDPAAAFDRIRSLLAPGGVMVVGDERRNIGAGASLLVAVLSRLIGPMGAFWRSSIAAGYTGEEARLFLEGAGFSEFRVEEEFLSLMIVARR